MTAPGQDGADTVGGPDGPGSGLTDALARFATGVVLLSVPDDEDGDALFTATSFTSVSLDPPMVLVGVTRGTWMQEVLDRTPTWALSVLTQRHRALAARFATPQRPSARVLLHGVPHSRGAESDALVLDEAAAVLECRTAQQVEAGDHVLVLGSVLTASRPAPDAPPLVRVDHRYAGLRRED